MDITVELGIAAKIHDDMTGKPNAMANSIRRGIAEIERLRAEIAELRARIADAPTAEVTLGCYLDADQLPPEFALRRVALVALND